MVHSYNKSSENQEHFSMYPVINLQEIDQQTEIMTKRELSGELVAKTKGNNIMNVSI